MTTNDSTYAARLTRLEGAGKGETVTIPADWDPPVSAGALEDHLAAARITAARGGLLTHDGTPGDGCPWETPDGHFLYTTDVAALGFDLDPAVPASTDQVAALDALPAGSRITFTEPRDFKPGAERNGIADRWRIGELEKEDNGSWATTGVTRNGDRGRGFILRSRHLPGLGVTAADFPGGEPAGEERTDYNHVHVGMSMGGARVVADRNVPRDRVLFGPADAELPADGDLEGAGFKPLVDLGVTSLSGTPADADDQDTDETDRSVGVPQVPALDEYQLERVAALEHALRILESRKTAEGGGGVADLFRSSAMPATAVQDLIDVAAFINDGDTGRIDEVQA